MDFKPLQKRVKTCYDAVLEDELIVEPLTIEQLKKGLHGDSLLDFMVYEAGDAANAAELEMMLRRASAQLSAVADCISMEEAP